MEERTSSAAPSERPFELDAKDERNVSWRVPNSPKQQHDIQDEGIAAKTDSPKDRGLVVSQEKSLTLKFDSNPASPSEGRKSTRVTKTASENSSDEPRNSSTSKLWRHLFAGVTRSVDELYAHCEEQEDRAKCQEVIELLMRNRLDFKKLSERIDEQSNFRQGQALSWDIRKPTLPSPNNPHGSNPGSHPDSPVPPEFFETPSNDSESAPAAGAEAAADAKPLSAKKLNPEAKPFSPSLFPSPPATAMVAVMDPMIAPALPPAVVRSGAAPSERPQSAQSGHQTAKRGNVVATSGTQQVVRSMPPGLAVHGPSRSLFGADTNREKDKEKIKGKAKEGEDWEDEARLQAEVQQASEQVWAAAEAWVEAEAAAEEQEWQMLALGIKSYLYQAGALSDYEDEPTEYKSNHGFLGVHSDSLSGHNSPKQFPVGVRLSLGGGGGAGDSNAVLAADWGGNALLLSPEQRAIWEEQPSPRTGLHRAGSGSAFNNRSRTGSRSNLLAHVSPKGAGAKKSVTSPRALRIDSPYDFSPGDYSPLSHSHLSPVAGRRDSSNSYRSPSESPTDFGRQSGTPGSASGGRSLHDKLSSPERKKARSPTELQRKIDERQTHAEMLRDRSVAERVHKASIASQRVKLAEEREAQRISEKKQVLEDKQLAAQERLQRNLRQIQVRANNETSKVNEVLFNKDLNKEAIAQRLEEAETRILAASTRRQERLQNMTLDQKRRNARKAQQLSEWRLQFDKENMDRWDKLQQRLDSVHARRAARLVELQRRADENAVASEAAAAASAAVKEEESAAQGDAAEAGAEVSAVATETPMKVHTSAEGTRLISALKKGVVSAQKAAKLNPSTRPASSVSVKSSSGSSKTPASPSTAKKSHVVHGDGAHAAAEAQSQQQRSKSKEKREKRKLKAQLIELAQQADYAAIQEALDLHGKGSAGDRRGGVEDLDTATPVVKEASAAERYLHAIQSFRPCPPQCVQQGFAAARALGTKKVNLSAKADLSRLCAADTFHRVEHTEEQKAGGGGALSREFTGSATESALLAAMQADIGVNGPHLLTLVVKDLLVASEQAQQAPAVLNMHVMQRLFVLLETAPLGSSPSKLSGQGSSNRAEATVSEVMLLRLMFGPEVGVLWDVAEYQTLLDALALQQCNHHPHWRGASEAACSAAVTQELEVKAEVWQLVFKLLDTCAGTDAGAGLILQSGLGTVLVDVLHALLKSMETAQGTAGAGYPTVLTFAATNILSALSRVVELVPRTGRSVGDLGASCKGLCSQASVDAFVWYIFTSSQALSVVETFRSTVQRWQECRSYHHTSSSAESAQTAEEDALFGCGDYFISASSYVSSICNFVGQSGGLGPVSSVAVVDSVLQLSPATHRHTKGRQLVSILRRAEILPALLGLLSALVSRDFSGLAGVADPSSASRTALVDQLEVLNRVVEATHSLVCADLSLAQGLSQEQQVLWVTTVSNLLGTLQNAIDGPPQTIFPAEYTGCGTVGPIELAKGDLEQALRRVLSTLTSTCSQNGPLQRLCGTPAAALSGGEVKLGAAASSSSSLLAQVCAWTPKYFKDKRFKHSVLPCLIALCLDCDANTAQLQRLDKLPALLKYLDHSVRTREVYAQQQARKKEKAGDAPDAAAATEEAQHVLRLSRLIPADLWPIALVTLSQRTPSS